VVSKSWLQTNLKHQGGLKTLDCSWYMPALKHPVKQDFKQNRIIHSQFFDVEEIADKSIPLPHMIPSPSQFESQVRELGISNDNHIICYDTSGQYMAAARVWWLFRLFGHDNVSVLHGKFVPTDWPTHDLEYGPTVIPPEGDFVSNFRPNLVVLMSDILENIETKKFQVVDARSSDRFHGRVAEPRPGVARGRIPNSFNVPFATVLKDFGLKSGPEIREVFQHAGVDLDKPIVTSCGSGITAAVLSLALHTIGIESAVYDGSWSEYGLETLGNPVDKE